MTIRIIHTALFGFLCYLTIGLLLAVLPGFVHLHLGFSPLWAGVAVSSQYLATLVTRPTAGRMTDVIGPRATVLLGQLVLLLSGLCLLAAALLQAKAMACFVVLLMSRVILGCGESCVATGALTWGLGRVAPEYAAQVISWSGIASYGAMAAGAPLGIWLETRYGLWSIGAAASGISLLSLALALLIAGVSTVRGTHLAFPGVLGRVALYGLGLTGHLREMLTWHTFGYLTPKHDMTSIGILLGLSAANVGSGNKHVTKLLAVHTPALLPTSTIDLNVPLITQSAGLVGLGLLYMGSKNRPFDRLTVAHAWHVTHPAWSCHITSSVPNLRQNCPTYGNGRWRQSRSAQPDAAR